MPNADVLIIGSGIAAFSVAEKLCQEKNVIIITKKTRWHNNSNMAQGGIAAAVASDDHWTNHYNDTLTAGCYYNNKEAVAYLVQQGPSEMQRLVQEGMQFDRDEIGLSLGKEGAHGERRILHAGGDATGKNLLRHFVERIKKQVTIVEHEMVLNLIIQDGTCIGVVTRDNDNVTTAYYAPHTVLATGGIGALYSFSSNDTTITGDGLAMAYRAGADMADLEFVQFHPTMLYINGSCRGLVSEAVRGEGAVLKNTKGERFMEHIHEQGDLAPRDVVAREIHEQILQGEEVYLDISMIDRFSSRFPTISALCKQSGLSLERGRIPVVPGAHFHMGGIRTNLNGETTIRGLYAVGETACNGVHGANRLASNSLLEGIVFGGRLGSYLLQQNMRVPKPIHHTAPVPMKPIVLPGKEEIQQMMMKCAGIVRTEEGLLEAKRWLEQYMPFDGFGTLAHEALTNEQVMVFNMLTASWLITIAALKRRGSIGGHFRSDFPHLEENPRQTVFSKKQLILQMA
ncbi:L-aspartate oxidase [Ectobacillus panaciterrae]|uniref:L-aspartate oxidase n=1 Tax=Ectobacillus panaciterrae TaxID=363872 RepID=UPI0003F8A46D|nr:L-aspartate oxidase [Ectobacillus panaciterrae]